jgi:hypothetical protein
MQENARKRVLVKFGATTFGEIGINSKRLSCNDVIEDYDYISPQYNLDMQIHRTDRKKAKVRIITSQERQKNKIINHQDQDSRGNPS